MAFARRRYIVTFVAVGGLAATWGLMIAFSWSSKLGVITFAPWVALIGFDIGEIGGLVAGGVAVGLWVVANHADNVTVDGVQIGVRAGSLAALALGSALAGRRLRASESAQRTIASLQSALIDSTLDGICLTSDDGEILISNRPLRRIGVELGLPLSGTVPERLLSIADKMAEPERYSQRMRELADVRGESTIDEFEVAGTGRVFRGYTAPVSNPDGSFAGRIWTLREVTADRELDRMRDAFVATVSHELRTPLTSISGFLEMMQEEEHGLGESGQALSRGDPAQHRPAARARRGSAADRADRGEARRAATRARSTSTELLATRDRGDSPVGDRQGRRRSRSRPIIRRSSTATGTG